MHAFRKSRQYTWTKPHVYSSTTTLVTYRMTICRWRFRYEEMAGSDYINKFNPDTFKPRPWWNYYTFKPRPWWNYYQSEWCFYNIIKRLTSCNVDGSKNCRNFLLYADPSSLTTDTVRSYGFLPIHVQNNIIWIDGNRTMKNRSLKI